MVWLDVRVFTAAICVVMVRCCDGVNYEDLFCGDVGCEGVCCEDIGCRRIESAVAFARQLPLTKHENF